MPRMGYGPYGDSAGVKQDFPMRDSVPVGAVAPPGQPNGVSPTYSHPGDHSKRASQEHAQRVYLLPER